MAKCIFLPYTPSISDLGFGPSKFACEDVEVPADPHQSFSIRAEIDSLYALENRLAVEHPDWTRDQIKAERRSIYRNEMFPSQRDSYLAEKNGVEDMRFDGAQWKIVNGELTNRGYLFQNMIDHASSDQERASLVAWREAALTVESGGRIVSLDYHVEDGGEFKIRYTDVWIKDGDSIKQERRLDLTKGKDIDLFSGLKLLQQLSQEEDKKIVYDEKNNIGLLIIKPGAEDGTSIKEKLRSGVREMTKTSSIGINNVTETQHAAVQVIDGIAREINITAEAFYEFMERQKRKMKESEEFKLHDFSAGKVLKDLLTDPQKISVLKTLSVEPEEVELLEMSEEETTALWIALAADVFNITPEQAHEVLDIAEETLELMQDAFFLIDFAVQPEIEGVGIPAALFALDILAHPEVLLMGKESASEVSVDQSINLQLDNEGSFVVNQQALKTVITFFTGEDEALDLESSNDSLEPASSADWSTHVGQEAEQMLRSEGVDIDALEKMKELISDIDQDSPEQAKTKIEDKQKALLAQMNKLWRVFQELQERRLKSATTGDTQISSSELQFALKSDTEAVKRSEREHVEDFSFAFTLWMLLKLNSYYQSLEALKGFVLDMFVKKDTSKQTGEPLGLIEKLKEKMPEGLIQKETTQWVLLAIIWQLSMMREAGLQTGQQSTQQSSAYAPQTTPLPYIPQYQVIFSSL